MILQFILGYLSAINVIAFIVYGIDKNRAQRQQWRIPETTLLVLAAIGGAGGALLGMLVFRHKTKHPRFKILVPRFLLIWVAALFATTSVVTIN